MEQAFTVLDLTEDVIKDTNSALCLLPIVVKGFISFARNQEKCRVEWLKALEERTELNEKLQNAHKEISEMERQVQTARRLLDDEKAKRQRVLEERDQMEHQLDMVRDLLKDNRNKLHDETKQKLCFLSKENGADMAGDRLDTITELDSTGSVMSDLSYTRDEDDLNISSPKTKKRTKRKQSSSGTSGGKRRRASTAKSIQSQGTRSDRLIAKTTVTVEHTGPINAKSVIKTIPSSGASENRETLTICPSAPPLSESDSEDIITRHYGTPINAYPFRMEALNRRPHHFLSKTMLKGELCNVCCKRIRFSALAAKCIDCKTICHSSCKDSAPIPCVPLGNTPTSKGNVGSIADYTPLVSPMVPALIVHCVKEIEARGLSEVGLYRIPGSDKDVKTLKEKFLKGKGVPNLSQVADIHIVCGCLKDFLRSLREPLITHVRWDEFVRASEIRNTEERRSRLHQIVSELPQPNRDTLSFLILHLQKVADSPECKMPISNLAKMFGPGIVGFSRSEPDDMVLESSQANKVMAELLAVPCDYWENFIQGYPPNEENYELQKTPSSNSLLNFFSTPGRSVRVLKKTRYFDTP